MHGTSHNILKALIALGEIKLTGKIDGYVMSIEMDATAIPVVMRLKTFGETETKRFMKMTGAVDWLKENFTDIKILEVEKLV
ncbi:hypothetical protein Ab1vBOLIVR5_gp258 [Agrobacterium phage OLIVR5]|uniref:Uncharacterized protein n=2 Tax=Caudoviricetes TaxID=2731619 RepID=A0A858MT69_9CAUD|nr:hypothetical protein KNU99_gp143 [Agrobacterium phage OLIVR5]QIW87906.1 hypothetical protein Ab1vBOLIVR5_gp258 [Agrobacterium phage OLIVR5]QIW88171.1 hypothetical protein Ab1vBOLIVR6_gp264 [Agrobacterium phage OLIVR6]